MSAISLVSWDWLGSCPVVFSVGPFHGPRSPPRRAAHSSGQKLLAKQESSLVAGSLNLCWTQKTQGFPLLNHKEAFLVVWASQPSIGKGAEVPQPTLLMGPRPEVRGVTSAWWCWPWHGALSSPRLAGRSYSPSFSTLGVRFPSQKLGTFLRTSFTDGS